MLNDLRLKIVVVILIFFINNYPETIFSQEKTILTLEKAITIALEKSYEMKTLRLSLVQAEQNLTAAKGRFKTNAEMSIEAPNWNEMVSEIPVPGQLPVFNTTGFTRYQGNLDINQPLPTDGRLTLRSQAYHRDVSTYRADSGEKVERSEMYSSVSLRFSQPLFTINRLRLGFKTANLGYERTAKRYKRSELDIVYMVTQSFFNLYENMRAGEIAQENLKQQQELYELARKKFEAGLIPEVEALQMEVDLAQSKSSVLMAEGALQRSEDTFKQLIGLKLTDQVGVQADFQVDHMDVDLQKAIDLALQYRTEIRENEIDVELAKINVKEADAKSEIRGDVNAFYDLTGVSDPNMPFGSQWQELWNSSMEDIKRRPHNRGVMFTLSVPIWDWGVNRAEVQSAKAALQTGELALQEEKLTIQRQVREVVMRLRESESRMQVLLQNQKVAQRAFEISMERFNNGDITSQELALNRNRLVQAKTSYLSAFIDYKLAIADLRRKTMWDFATDSPLLEKNQ